MTTNDEIDLATGGLLDLLQIAKKAWPQYWLEISVVSKFISYEAHKLKAGIADGSIVPDGQGGLIPAHGQSYYDPKTGEFTGKKT